jgi:hypothetical protein
MKKLFLLLGIIFALNAEAARKSSYATKAPPLDGGDKVLGTAIDNTDKNFTLDGIKSYIAGTQVTVINNLSQLGTPVAGYYQLSEGNYIFDGDFDFGTTGIELTDTDGFYLLSTPGINTLIYSGTDPFIINSSTGTLLKTDNMIINTPNATAMVMANGNSFLNNLTLFSGCKKAFELTSFEFLTTTGPVMVGCENGATLNNVEVTTLDRPQWNDGQDLNGVAWTVLGASAKRFIMTRSDTEMASTEAFLDIQATFGGIASISGGAHSAGDFFAAASRKQDDPSIKVNNVAGVEDSNTIGFVSAEDNATATVINTIDVFEDLNLNSLAVLGANSERFELVDSTTGELRYIGLEPFSGAIEATISATGVGGTSQYHFRAYKNGTTAIMPITKNEIGTVMSNTSMHTPVSLVTNDTIRIQVANSSGTSNITVDTIAINIQ